MGATPQQGSIAPESRSLAHPAATNVTGCRLKITLPTPRQKLHERVSHTFRLMNLEQARVLAMKKWRPACENTLFFRMRLGIGEIMRVWPQSRQSKTQP